MIKYKLINFKKKMGICEEGEHTNNYKEKTGINNMQKFPLYQNQNYYNTQGNNTYVNKEYNCQYYREHYKNQKPSGQLQNPLYTNNNQYQQNYFVNQNREQLNNNNNIQNNYEFIELEKKFKNIKNQNISYYHDFKNQKDYINNYKTFINELNQEINNFNDQLNISVNGQILEENLISKDQNAQILHSLEELSYKINQLNTILYTQKKELKNLEIKYKNIQEKLNEIKQVEYNNAPNKQMIFLMNKDIIHNYLYDLEGCNRNLKNNKVLYENEKVEIEQDIKKIKNIMEKNVKQIKIKRKNSFKNLNLSQKQNNQMNDNLFLKGSMLLGIEDFSNVQDIFKSIYLFQEKDEQNYDKQELLKKNWNEICNVYDDYDIHDVNYELKAVGLPENVCFTCASFGFYLDFDIQILEFKINGLKSEYNFEKFSIRFKIKLKNLETCKIHLKYKKTPMLSKATEGELRQKDISKARIYGLSKRLVGQTAKYTLKNWSNFEIINFENEFFLKTNENEYTWGGRVPEEGKLTVVRLSKSKGRFKFYEKQEIKNMNKQPINNTTLKMPNCYYDGNNELIQFTYYSKQTKRINKDEKTRSIVAQFINTQSNIGELEIKGELINRCKGEWICKLTDEEIESLIPEDCKFNKQKFKEIALRIIKEYDEQHKNDLLKIHDVAKIGKWVHQNVKYNINYNGRNDLTATDTYKNLEGVCDHFTKLYNALAYSLGYKVIYVIGYALDLNDSYGPENGHAWSLIQINGKWLPFDSTWGIFTGKLPVSHIFRSYDSKGIAINGYDYVNFGKPVISGKFIK